MLHPQSEDHRRARNAIRLMGAILAIIALGMIARGFSVFFSPFSALTDLRPFIWAVLGLPLLGLGLMLASFGYLGKLARYQAHEIAPVAKDTFGYIARETKDSIQEVARSITEGIREGVGNPAPATERCHHCGHGLKREARFCDQCGTSVARALTCPECHAAIDSDARHCPSCGTRIPSSARPEEPRNS